MALLNPTFILGVCVLLYLSSFIVFAILRIVTGISIQRVGYLCLKRLAYTPRDGVRIDLRGLGINLHRPTFAQPTWLSIVLQELAVTVDLNVLEGDGDNGAGKHVNGDTTHANSEKFTSKPPSLRKASSGKQRSKSWETLNKVKERIKRLHRKINWLRMVDVVATSSSLTVVGVGNWQVGNFTVAVDTRRKMVDRSRMFQHKKQNTKRQRPAEWILTLRSILFTPQGKESLEVLDHATLNIHGLLYDELDGLRDAAISLKLGRVHIPYDDLYACLLRAKSSRKSHESFTAKFVDEDMSMEQIMEHLERPGGKEDKLTQTVNDSKEFASSILRGIKEVQLAVGYVGFTTQVSPEKRGTEPAVYVNASMKEIGVEVHRLDPKSPAHRMYFSPKDIAHQALVAALSIEVGVDYGQGKSERILYVPMSTTTVRTTLPSKTVETIEDRSADERNANIMFANVVITSPSIDLDPKHLPIILALLRRLRRRPKASKSTLPRRHTLISRLLPKANIKFSMHEPVVRITLPPVEDTADPEDFDLIISSISSIGLDVESSHSEASDLHYSLVSTFRVQSHNLYYQSSSAKRHDLLHTESMEVKVQVSATPEVYVVASGNLQTFSVHLNRPEISDGVRQIMNQLRLKTEPDRKFRVPTSKDPNFVRTLPPWLLHFQFQASDFRAEVAGIDESTSEDIRGMALQLESWTAEYRAQRMEFAEHKHSRRRHSSRSLTPDTGVFKNMQSPRKRQANATDGRRLTFHGRGLEGFVTDSKDEPEQEPFISIPRFEIALSTSSDSQGTILHFNSHVRTVLVQYSLYRHYAIGIAIMVLNKAFAQPEANASSPASHYSRESLSPMSADIDLDTPEDTPISKELVTIDVRATLIQIKAQMPSDPPLMLQIYGMEAGRHRWSPPFLHAKLVRLYVAAPKMKRVWARIASIKTAQLNLREGRKRTSSGQLQDERVIDINTEAIRLAVPHQVVLHTTFDNIVTTIKATEQLHHRFKTGADDYIHEKGPEGPKNIPKISLRSRALLFELEDGAFEWKLGTIYRAGLVEQQQRLAREQAYNIKVKKLEAEKTRDPNRFRARSAHPRGRSKQKDDTRPRSKSNVERSGSRNRKRSMSPSRSRRMRYDPEGTCGITGVAKISAQEAWEKLQKHNAQSWKRRIDRVYDISSNNMKEFRGVFWGPDQLPDDMEETENILEVPNRPALMATLISDLHIAIGKPSFPMNQLATFLHSVGKGMPQDMKYTLLVPMHVQISMGEARVTLRDYPLPLLHVPAMKPGQSARLPSWSLKSDFVIAEEYRGKESSRYIKVDIIPPDKGNLSLDVRRTVSPVKTYSEINTEINTSIPTRITWGASYQPAIQDMMMVIETFTKPQLDPSDRTGFWDKIRLSFHSRVNVAWKGDGAVHLTLKGTKDPYVVTGNGAGFVMCWRNDVKLSIARDKDPRKLILVDSGEYVLAIPDYSQQAKHSDNSGRDDASIQTANSYRKGAVFKKVIMKLSGNVQWVAGLMFERNTEDGGRSFEFKPHYNVILKGPSYCKPPPGQEYDAFQGFRSQHIHMSIAVSAPVDREWSVTNMKASDSYNTVHLTPRFFSHFFAWWSMFGGTMSLPIRQGTLWPGIDKSSKKFGRHLATIKYNLLLAPLFISHIYKHKEVEDYTEDSVSATGIKMKLDSFMLDMHQRREEFPTSQEKSLKTQAKASGMKIHRAQLDLLSADIRAISASMARTTAGGLRRASAPSITTQQEPTAAELSSFNIPDNDFSWVDMDDFVELDEILPGDANPDIQVMPLAFAPRFTFFRQTDHGDNISGEPDRTSAFGEETTHFCIMSQDDDPRRVQCQLIKSRLKEVEEQISEHSRDMGAAELRRIQSNGRDQRVLREIEELEQFVQVLRGKKLFLRSMYHRMATRVHTDTRRAVPDGDTDVDSDGENPFPTDYDIQMEGMDSNPAADFSSDFNNRFVIHNMQMKWNNDLRNVILRYIHQVSQRRGFVYYLSRRAVKFILDIVEEQKSKSMSRSNTKDDLPKASKQSQTNSHTPSVSSPEESSAAAQLQERIDELLSDGKKFVNADENHLRETPLEMSAENLVSNIAQEFTPQNSYHLRLIAPQIQLQSEKNTSSVVLVTAKGMELKVIEVMDNDRISDSVSGLVQRRFSVEMDSTQFFVTQQKWFSSQLLKLYSGNHYGTPSGSAWPPWVPMEIMVDFKSDPFGFKRVVQKTSASLRYDKYNTLRLKFNDEIEKDGADASSPDNVESRMDHVWVEFPQVRAICDSAQYYAIYIIVLDLLLYNEPMEKTRSERLEKIMLASDFSDLRGAPEMVIRLQERIRQLEEIKTQFMVHSTSLDKHGWEDRLLLEQDLANCEDELFFMMKAITTSQRKYDGSQTSGLLKWNISSEQIVWHLMRDDKQPLMEFQLKDAEYNRTDNTDGSHINTLEISRIVGLNLLPDAIYPEMIAPYLDDTRGHFDDGADPQMLRVYWYMLEAIAGIPVMDHFEVNLFPMKIQLEREVGKKLFEYVFPGTKDNDATKNSSPFLVKNMQPMGDEDETEDSNDASLSYSSPRLSFTEGDRPSSNASTRPASLEMRLRPTLTSEHRPRTSHSSKTHKGTIAGEGHQFRLFQSGIKRSKSNSRPPSVNTMSKKSSYDSLTSAYSGMPRPGVTRTGTALAKEAPSQPKKMFGLSGKDKSSKKSSDQNKHSDDLTKMMSRASNYMTLAYVKIPSVVLCLSYKGKGERNLEDVHNFVFRLPMLEYRNKTWSNLDLALALKRDVIKALISHTGAIIGNKLRNSRPSNAQQSRLRELATSSMLLTPETGNSDDSSSIFRNNSPPRHVVSFDRSKSPSRSNSRNDNDSDIHGRAQSRDGSSSIHSYQSSRRSQSLRMTPSNPASTIDIPASSERRQSQSSSVAGSELHNSPIAESEEKSGSILGRIGSHVSRREKREEEPEESRKKSIMLLGKKIFQGT